MAMRGGRRGGLWSEEEIASSGTGSKRAQGRERSLRGPLREPGDPGVIHGYVAVLRKWTPGRLRWKARFGDEGSRLIAPLGVARGDDLRHPLLPRLHLER